MKKYKEINIKFSETVTDLQITKLKKYFKEMPINETLSGLKFAKNRWVAKDAGILKVGRKSILKKEMPINETLSGLKFAKNRWVAKDAGILKVGRKSILKKEIHSVTTEQALWRIKNWKMMIVNYRRRGYSYPTISRIKKQLILISKNNSKL